MDRRLGRPLPHQQANPTQAHPTARGLAIPRFAPKRLCGISSGFPELSPTVGQIPTRYSPVRHSPPILIAKYSAAVRLACVKHSASVQSEPGSNSSIEFDRLISQANFWLDVYYCLYFYLSTFTSTLYLFEGLSTKAPTQTVFTLLIF